MSLELADCFEIANIETLQRKGSLGPRAIKPGDEHANGDFIDIQLELLNTQSLYLSHKSDYGRPTVVIERPI